MDNPSIQDTLGELDAGIFLSKVEAALKNVAIGVVTNDKKKGKVTIELELERINGTSSVQVHSTLKYLKPTNSGEQAEKSRTSTPMYVNNLGYLTISPQTQADLFKEDQTIASAGIRRVV